MQTYNYPDPFLAAELDYRREIASKYVRKAARRRRHVRRQPSVASQSLGGSQVP